MKRAEFLRVGSKGTRASMPAFVLQALKDSEVVRYGLTATKKLGNAVKRNRARRRLRALAEKILHSAAPGNFVLVAREGVFKQKMTDMEQDLAAALKKLGFLHKK
jgi:ribonuclease P protein component